MTTYEATAMYSETGYMTINIGDESGVDAAEWIELQDAFFEKIEDLDTSDIDTRCVCESASFRILAAFFVKSYEIDKNGIEKEFCDHVNLLIEIDEESD
jgi:hypothetical protein